MQKLHVASHGTIENEGKGMLQVRSELKHRGP